MAQQKTKKIGLAGAILNKTMNVTSDEWPRIAISWLLQFFYRTAYIIGWTALLSMFVMRFGILALPFFFIINAVARIVGAFLYANIINHFRKDKVILFTAIIAASFMLLSLFIGQINETAFIFIALPTIAIFFSQLYIVNSAFIEELFSPLESERTFPVIESAETIAGIVGGFFIIMFAQSFAPIYLMHLVVMLLVLIVPVILFHRQILKKLPFVHFKKKKNLTKFNLANMKKSFSHMKYIPFLKVLFVVVLIQWIFFNLLEFQYTSAVYENISSSGGHAEQELTHGLGSLQILFHSFALAMQLFVASRIISSLGIVGSLLLHPVVALLSLGSMLFNFGFTSAILAKTNFEMTNIIHKNAYHTSYYAIAPNVREHVREFLEGFVHPLGALVGTGTILVLEQIFVGGSLTFSITILMIVMMVAMLFVLLRNESKYTHISVKNLLHSNDVSLQLNAVEVLGQRGHRNATEVLTRTLQQSDLDNKVRIKILETLGHIKEEDAILDILNSLRNEDKKVRMAALHALNKFDNVQKHKRTYPFSNHRANHILKELFEQEEDKNMKSLIMSLMAKINKHEIVPFLLGLLETKDDRLKADCIVVCGSFHDINLVHYLLPYLESENPHIRARTIVALWQFKKYRVELSQILKQMLYSTDKNERLEAFYVIGEVNAIQEKNRLIDSLNSEDKNERFVASISLAKLGVNECIPSIVKSIMSNDEELSGTARHQIQDLPKNMLEKIEKAVRQRVSEYINIILADTNKTSLEELDRSTLLKLRRAYELVNEHEEVQNIDEVLQKQEDLKLKLQFNPT